MAKVNAKLLWEASEKIMRDRGWTPEESPLEFDRKLKDSQIVLIKEDLEEMLTYFHSSEVWCDKTDCDKKDILIYTHIH